jgi:hypothetical protein
MRLKSTLLLLGLILTASFSPLKATHLVGGSITWECVSSGKYVFTLSLYRDCAGIILPTTSQNISGPAGNIVCTYISNRGMSNQCSTPPNGCLLEEYIYRSSPVSLTGTPPAAGWEFNYNTCCRTTYINDAASPGAGFHLRAIMYPYQDPATGQVLNANTCYDNSPSFGQAAAMEVCDGPFFFNHQAMDLDQDSISVAFTDVLSASNTPTLFGAGYSAQLPFPDSSENAANGPVVLDPLSGNLQIETYNAPAGFYKNCLKIESWRNGQKIAETFKELPLHKLPSGQCTANAAPSVSIDTANYPQIQRSGNTYRITAMNNDTINFQVLVQDFDFNSNGVPQTFCVSANGVKMNPANPSLDSNCVGGYPCATLSPFSSNGYCGALAQAFEFNWVANCSFLSAGLRGRTSYLFHIMADDQACPVSKMGNITVIVDLFPAASGPPSLAITGGNTSGDLDLAWSPTNIQADAPFDKYILYANNGPGTPFFAIDSVMDRSQTQLALSGLAFPAEVYMNQITGSCRSASVNSDTLNSDMILAMAGAEAFPFSIYPQPSKGLLHIEGLGALKGVNRALLLNANGALIEQFELDPQASSWDLNLEQAAGIYILRLEGEGQAYHRKIILK